MYVLFIALLTILAPGVTWDQSNTLHLPHKPLHLPFEQLCVIFINVYCTQNIAFDWIYNFACVCINLLLHLYLCLHQYLYLYLYWYLYLYLYLYCAQCCEHIRDVNSPSSSHPRDTVVAIMLMMMMVVVAIMVMMMVVMMMMMVLMMIVYRINNCSN